jgi:hypothetical protein
MSYERVSVLKLLDGLDLSQLPSWAVADSEPPAKSGAPPAAAPRTIKVLLASSSELRADRDGFDLYFRQQNDYLRKQGIYLEITARARSALRRTARASSRSTPLETQRQETQRHMPAHFL